MNWILIAIITTVQGSTVTFIEFNTRPACERAVEVIKANVRGWNYGDITCVPKGEK